MSLTTELFEPRLMPVDTTYNFKRKRSHLSSPPISPAEDDVRAQTQEQDLCKVQERGTQTSIQEELHIPENNAYSSWSGRGRSPFKTPATAALDNLRNSSRLLEQFEREIAQQQGELDLLLVKKQRYLAAIQQKKLNLQDPQMEDILKNKPNLPPPRNPTRSLSPDKYLARLPECQPSVAVYALNRVGKGLPKPTRETVEFLQNGLEYGCIPYQYKDEVKRLQPFSIMEHTVEQTPSIPNGDAEALWKKAKQVMNQAAICLAEHRDENAWSMNVVRPVMEWETLGATRARAEIPFSRTEYIQTQSIAKACLQTSEGQPCEGKKADFALSFSPEHPVVEQSYKALKFIGYGSPLLSQMNDVCTSKLVLYLGAEVKKFGGNEAEAQGQLFTWLASGVIRLRKLLEKTGNDKTMKEPTPPLLGWTIVGHKWELYACVGKSNGDEDRIYVIGPLTGCTCDIRDYPGAFKLLRLSERIKQWGRERYWPWFVDKVAQPLALLGGAGLTQEDIEDGEEMSGMEDDGGFVEGGPWD